MDYWFNLHLPDNKARLMAREAYYAARSYLRRVRHIIHLRHLSARINPDNPMEILIPATDDVLPPYFSKK